MIDPILSCLDSTNITWAILENEIYQLCLENNGTGNKLHIFSFICNALQPKLTADKNPAEGCGKIGGVKIENKQTGSFGEC